MKFALYDDDANELIGVFSTPGEAREGRREFRLEPEPVVLDIPTPETADIEFVRFEVLFTPVSSGQDTLFLIGEVHGRQLLNMLRCAQKFLSGRMIVLSRLDDQESIRFLHLAFRHGKRI